MADDFSAALDALQRRFRQMYDEIGPVRDRSDRFLTMLHGEGWKERATADPRNSSGYAARVRDLEKRIARIEYHLKLAPKGD